MADFNGELVVPATVNDGAADSAVFDLSVQVTAVNDAPVISNIEDQGIPEGAAFTVIDLDEYVTDKALDGLFLMLAEEEKKIRQDPAARVTDLLKKVFAKR